MIKYTFSTTNRELLGNVLMSKIDGASSIKTDLQVVVVSEPIQAFKYMDANSKLFKCTVNQPLSVKEFQTPYHKPEGKVIGPQSSISFGCTGHAGVGVGSTLKNKVCHETFLNSVELSATSLENIEEIDINQYIGTTEFCDWLLRNVIENETYIKKCFKLFNTEQRAKFISYFPYNIVAMYTTYYNEDEIWLMHYEHTAEFESQLSKLDGTLLLSDSVTGKILPVLARLFPERYRSHENLNVRLEAEKVLAKIKPYNYMYHEFSEVRSIAYTTAVSLVGEEHVAARVDFSKETDDDLKILKLNKYSCHHFVNDKNKFIRYNARKLRNSFWDRLWLPFNKE